MLRFAVYDNDGPASSWPLHHAHLVGPDEQPCPGSVQFRSGHIECTKRDGHAVGLCLQCDAGEMGQLMLSTCLLPDRREPYILSVELARHRIKMFIVKSEEWQMFDMSPEQPAMQLWERARRLFSEALIADDPVAADQAAQRSLIDGIKATERLAMLHADILLHRRYGRKAASSATLGVRVWPYREGKALRELVERDFDVLFIPMNWRELEVEEGRYRWGPVDRWIDWARQEGKPIVAGPLLDFSKRSIPDWMYVWQHDFDTCRDLAYDHIERVVHRYHGAVGMWNLASGLSLNDNFTFTPAQMIDLTRMAGLLVRQIRKSARVLVELRQPFGESCATQRDALPGLTYVERLLQEGIRLDAVGVQLLFGGPEPGTAARDLMQISSLLDRFFLLELPILVSAMGVPSEPVPGRGGSWREPWSPRGQERWIGRVFNLALSKPFVESVFWADLFDHERALLPGSGLISDDGRPKPSLRRMIALRRRLRKPLGPGEDPLSIAAAKNDG